MASSTACHGIAHRIAAASLAVLAATVAPACYVDVPPEPMYAEGYSPAYYDGYVVYFDGAGRPFYYEGGRPMWVPVGSPYYGGLVAHWHTYGHAYGGWYAHYGAHYRSYRGRR
jgi:hypothetical protein